jgi:hypothetical protein
MIASELIAPPLGSYLMDKYGPLVPFGLGIPFELLCFPILFTIPNTKQSSYAEERRANRWCFFDTEEIENASEFRRGRPFSLLLYFVKSIMSRAVLFAPLQIPVIALLVNKLSHSIYDQLLQFMSVRFNWTLAMVRAASTGLLGTLI